jgi:hypothetical protein
MTINPLIAVVLVASLIGAIFLLNGLHAVRKLQLFRAFRHFVIMLLCMTVSGATGILLVANRGYRALTNEELAATVTIVPVGKQRFIACVTMADSSRDTFQIAGDMLYVDAHILKWNPLLNILGIGTSYELDRIGGRYLDIEDEKEKKRTVYSLSENRLINMYALRRAFAMLNPLLDAEYGSATFAEADRAATRRVMVSTSGLLIR